MAKTPENEYKKFLLRIPRGLLKKIGKVTELTRRSTTAEILIALEEKFK